MMKGINSFREEAMESFTVLKCLVKKLTNLNAFTADQSKSMNLCVEIAHRYFHTHYQHNIGTVHVIIVLTNRFFQNGFSFL